MAEKRNLSKGKGRPESNPPTGDTPPLDLTTRHGVCHWARIVGNHLLTLANNIPDLKTLDTMLSSRRSALAGDVIGNTLATLDEYGWDKVLCWLRDHAPRGLTEDLKDKYEALPVHAFRYVVSLAAELPPGKTHLDNSPGPALPHTASELIHLKNMLHRFGESLVEVGDLIDDALEVARAEPDRPDPMSYRFGRGYRCVFWYGQEYSFTPSQAAVVEVLADAYDANAPDVDADVLVGAALSRRRKSEPNGARQPTRSACATCFAVTVRGGQ